MFSSCLHTISTYEVTLVGSNKKGKEKKKREKIPEQKGIVALNFHFNYVCGVFMYCRLGHNVKCISYCGSQCFKNLKALLTFSVLPILTLLFLSLHIYVKMALNICYCVKIY